MADCRMPWLEGATARGDEARRPRRPGSRRNARDLRSVRRRSLRHISTLGLRGYAMHPLVLLIGLVIFVAASSGIEAANGDPIYVDQGPGWTTETRSDFYTRDQGSRLINLAWLQALKQQNGQPFLADGLSRYGFLSNPDPGNTANLPIGVHTTGPRGSEIVGITCSACHTRQLEVDGKTYRIDGGP